MGGGLQDTTEQSPNTISTSGHEEDVGATQEPRKAKCPWLGRACRRCRVLGERLRWSLRPLLPLPARLHGGGSPVSHQDAWEFAKLCVVVVLILGAARLLVCHGFRFECDLDYDIKLFARQDLHTLVFDVGTLFCIGRMGTDSPMPVDSVAFLALACLGALYPSVVSVFDFAQHSMSLYTVLCVWPPLTWVMACVIVSVILFFAALHLRFICTLARSEQVRLLAEVIFVVLVFVVPFAIEPGFHAHHWYVSWLLALVCRFPRIWSRSAQAFLLGGYINGIAVWGRDPMLACQAAYDFASHGKCPWLQECTFTQTYTTVDNVTVTYVAPAYYREPDWRTCTAGDYA